VHKLNQFIYFQVMIMGLLAGCSSQITLTVLSDPPGAAVLQSEELAGYAPMNLYYPKSVMRESDDGCWQSPPITLEWESGATRTLSVTICKDVGFDQELTIVRPDAPGIEEDIEAAIAMKRRRAEDLKREQDEHEAALFRSLSHSTQNKIPGRPDNQN
jgi:hypothetical protein